MVPIVEAAVAIKKDEIEKPWETVQDLQFINTTGHILVIHFEPSFTVYNLDLNKPFGLIQQEQSIKISLHALPTGFDAWFMRLDSLDLN